MTALGRLRQYWRRFGVSCSAAIGIAAAAWLFVGARGELAQPPTSDIASGAPEALRTTPIRIETNVAFPDDFDPARVCSAVRRLNTQRATSVSKIVHVVRLLGPECAFVNSDGATVRMLDAVLDHEHSLERFGGKSALISTRDGVRCPVVSRRNMRFYPERQIHTDQLLASLAEAGIPLTRRISTVQGEYVVGDLLGDSIANYDPSQHETEWSALAFALYLPPRNSWRDKFGQEYTFDALARDLMSRRFDRQDVACGGTHLLYSMAVLYRVDQRWPVLSPPVREEARRYLQRMTQQAVQSQLSDGTWHGRWYDLDPQNIDMQQETDSANWRKVWMTGHHLEWLLLLPDDMLPPRDCFLRAASFLQASLLTDPDDVMQEHFCPYFHAARVIMTLSAIENVDGPDAGSARAKPSIQPAPGGGLGQSPARAEASS